jgi:hypothetical protein
MFRRIEESKGNRERTKVVGMPEHSEEEEQIMTWYAASIVMYTKFKEGGQDKYPIWENVILISAESGEEALEKAKKRGQADEGDSDGTYFCEDRAATMVFGGVRKIIEAQDSQNRPDDGTEITYSQMMVDNEEALRKLVSGESVTILYEE